MAMHPQKTKSRKDDTYSDIEGEESETSSIIKVIKFPFAVTC